MITLMKGNAFILLGEVCSINISQKKSSKLKLVSSTKSRSHALNDRTNEFMSSIFLHNILFASINSFDSNEPANSLISFTVSVSNPNLLERNPLSTEQTTVKNRKRVMQ